jgi:multiple sugar transport system permease protein
MKKRSLFNFLPTRILQVLLAVLFLLPIVWMIAASLTPAGTPLPRNLGLISSEITFENFKRAWHMVPFGQFTLNSLRVVSLAVPLTLVTSSWAGFAMSQLPRPNQRRWIAISLIVLMIPGIALWSTRFILYREIGIYNSIWALIAPALMGTSPFFVLMYYRAFRRIPHEVYESARLDGAGILQSWRLIALPIARPTSVGVALLGFVYYWGDFISPLLYLQSEKNYTLPIALQLLHQMGRSDWSLLMAAAVLSLTVPMAFFFIAQPFITSRK